MEQIPPWKSNSRSASQEVPHQLWNPKIHYHVHKSLPPVPILSQMNPFHTFIPCLRRLILVNIVILSRPWSLKWSSHFRFSDYNFARISHLPRKLNYYLRNFKFVSCSGSRTRVSTLLITKTATGHDPEILS